MKLLRISLRTAGLSSFHKFCYRLEQTPGLRFLSPEGFLPKALKPWIGLIFRLISLFLQGGVAFLCVWGFARQLPGSVRIWITGSFLFSLFSLLSSPYYMGNERGTLMLQYFHVNPRKYLLQEELLSYGKDALMLGFFMFLLQVVIPFDAERTFCLFTLPFFVRSALESIFLYRKEREQSIAPCFLFAFLIVLLGVLLTVFPFLLPTKEGAILLGGILLLLTVLLLLSHRLFTKYRLLVGRYYSVQALSADPEKELQSMIRKQELRKMSDGRVPRRKGEGLYHWNERIFRKRLESDPGVFRRTLAIRSLAFLLLLLSAFGFSLLPITEKLLHEARPIELLQAYALLLFFPFVYSTRELNHWSRRIRFFEEPMSVYGMFSSEKEKKKRHRVRIGVALKESFLYYLPRLFVISIAASFFVKWKILTLPYLLTGCISWGLGVFYSVVHVHLIDMSFGIYREKDMEKTFFRLGLSLLQWGVLLITILLLNYLHLTGNPVFFFLTGAPPLLVLLFFFLFTLRKKG